MKRIKVAVEQTVIVPDDYTDEQIDKLIESKCPGKNYIWCNDSEELFESEKN